MSFSIQLNWKLSAVSPQISWNYLKIGFTVNLFVLIDAFIILMNVVIQDIFIMTAEKKRNIEK